MSEARTSSWQERDVEELRAREASYRDRLAYQAALAERLNSYSNALQRMLRTRPPSRVHLSSTMLEVAKLSSLALAIERTSIWLFDPNGGQLHCSIQLVNHVEQPGEVVSLDTTRCPSYLAALSESHAVAVEDVYTDARTVELHDYLRQRNIGALLDIPIAIPGSLLGVVCHEHVGSPRIWHREEIEFGANVGSLLALALETERRLTAEHAQHGTEAKYRHLVEALPVTVYSFEVNTGKLDYISPRVYELGGWTAERWLGAGAGSWVERVHPEDRPKVLARFEPGAARGFPEEITYRVQLPDGRLRWVRDLCSLVRDAHGRALALQGVLTDVTPQIEAELEREELERRHRFLLDHADLLGVMVDAEGRVTFVNDYLCRVMGYTRSELIGRNWFEFTTPAAERQRLQAEYQDGLARGWIEPRIQAPLRTASGERREILWTNTLLRRTDGVPQGVSGIGVDMTQRLRLEAELQQQTKLDSLGRLAAGVAHDFNNLLTVMIAESDRLGGFLNDREAGEVQDARVAQRALGDALRQAAELTQSLLVYGRQKPLSSENVLVDELVQDALRLATSIAGPELKVEASLQCGRARVRLERSQLCQVLLNLVGNASDATRGVGKEIRISTHLELVDAAVAHRQGGAQAGEFVVLTVADDGCGMDERTLARIFDPFFTTKSGGRGTGLGLAMCQSIVNRAGGFIQVDSQPRQGTRFRIFLPNASSGSRPSVPSSVSGLVDASGARGGKQVRVLVVEDVTGIRNVLVTCLRQANYRVFEAATVANAAQILASQPIDVLITDGNLPDGSGLVLARSARTVQPELKLILVSGSMEADPGFDAILLKPFDVSELMRAVECVLADQDSAPA